MHAWREHWAFDDGLCLAINFECGFLILFCSNTADVWKDKWLAGKTVWLWKDRTFMAAFFSASVADYLLIILSILTWRMYFAIRRSSESFRSAGSTPQGRLRLLPLSLDNGLNKEVTSFSFWIFVSQRHWCSRFLKQEFAHDIFQCPQGVFFFELDDASHYRWLFLATPRLWQIRWAGFSYWVICWDQMRW